MFEGNMKKGLHNDLPNRPRPKDPQGQTIIEKVPKHLRPADPMPIILNPKCDNCCGFCRRGRR